MGKKSLISGRYLRKAETLAIVLITFLLYFLLREEVPGKDEEETPLPAAAPAGKIENGPETKERKAVYFDAEVAEIVKEMIASAKKTVYAATYTYSKNEITALLEKKRAEGVKIKVAAGKNKDRRVPDHDFSLVRMKNGIYHPKFFVFDGRDVLILSANISSEKSAFNNAVLFRDVPAAAAILENEIDDVFEGKIVKRCENGCETEIGTIFFNPGKGCVNVKKEILAAKESLKAGIYTITPKNPMVSGLRKAIKKGVKTSIIVDNWRGNDGKTVNKRAFSYLESLGARLKYDETGENSRVFHHKFAEIDGKTVIFGSMNWTSSACYRNREIVVVSRDSGIAGMFSAYFDGLF